MEDSRSIPRERMCLYLLFIEHHVHVIWQRTIGGRVGDRGVKGEEEDQMSAESSGIEDSKDGWDGLGHQVSIVRLSHASLPSPQTHSLLPDVSLDNMTRTRNLQKTSHSSRSAMFAKKTKTDAGGQPRGNPRLSHVSSLSFPPERGLQLPTVMA